MGLFGALGICERERAIDFVGGYMVKACNPVRARDFKQIGCPDDVRFHKNCRTSNRIVDVTFGSKVNDVGGAMGGKYVFQARTVANISLYKAVVGRIADGDVVEVGSIGECIEVDEGIGGVFGHHEIEKIAPNKSCAPGDEYCFFVRHRSLGAKGAIMLFFHVI